MYGVFYGVCVSVAKRLQTTLHSAAVIELDQEQCTVLAKSPKVAAILKDQQSLIDFNPEPQCPLYITLYSLEPMQCWRGGARLQAELGWGWYALCVGMSSLSFHVSFEYNDKLIDSQILLFELYLIQFCSQYFNFLPLFELKLK